jgi:hypothetical protein
MDPTQNPFSPGAGSPPPELVGRDPIIDQGRILFARVKRRRAEKSFLLTGLRGVGKTVLLLCLEQIAAENEYKTIFIEAPGEKPLATLLIPPLRHLLFSLGRFGKVGEKARRGLSVLKSFITAIKIKAGDFEFGIDIEPEKGIADSGDIETDLPNLFLAVAEAAQEHNTAIAILIDELQYLASSEISALIMAMHKMQQKQLPLVLIGAGLPVLPALAGESKSYAERLFQFPDIGPLSLPDANKALNDPVKDTGLVFSDEALQEIYRVTQGYPYFLQEWGYQCWNHATERFITLQLVKEVTPKVMSRLDENFFRVRFNRLTPSEKNYLRAMAELGPSAHRSGEIATILGVKLSNLGPVRASLIKKGMIYSPTHGDMAFTVPLFDKFMRRMVPNL